MPKTKVLSPKNIEALSGLGWRMVGTRTICMLAYDGAQSLDITRPLEVFALADRQARDDDRRARPLYRVHVLGPPADPS